MKYRIKHDKLSNGKDEYTIQRRFLFIFWKTKIVDMGLYGSIQTFDTLDDALKSLKRIQSKEESVKVLETNYIWRKE